MCEKGTFSQIQLQIYIHLHSVCILVHNYCMYLLKISRYRTYYSNNPCKADQEFGMPGIITNDIIA